MADKPRILFWVNNDYKAPISNPSSLYDVKLFMLERMNKLPLPEDQKERLVKLFKGFGFENPEKQIYMPFYLRRWGGKFDIKTREYDYTNVDWDAVHAFFEALCRSEIEGENDVKLFNEYEAKGHYIDSFNPAAWSDETHSNPETIRWDKPNTWYK